MGAPDHSARIETADGTALFLMMPEWSGILPTLPLARALQSRGIRVLYAGLQPSASRSKIRAGEMSRFQQHIENQGFEYFYYGGRPTVASARRGLFRRPSELIYRLMNGIELLIRNHSVDLTLVDAILTYHGLAAARAGIPVVALSTNYLSFANKDTPPFTSSMLPGPDGVFAVSKVQSAWRLRYLRLSLTSPFTTLIRHLWKEGPFRAACRQTQQTYGFTEYGYRPHLPKYVLSPKLLDFGATQGHHYLGFNVDESRMADRLPWTDLREDKPLIYCSLGSQSYMYFPRRATTFIRTVIEAFRKRSDYQLVLHIGVDRKEEEFADLPQHIKIASWLPQLAILQHATAAITHGGLNTIKECIFSSVPMVVMNSVHDAPGNIARVVHHGLGVGGVELKRCTADQLLDMVDEVVENPLYSANVKRMRQQILEANEMEAGIEEILALAMKNRRLNSVPND